MGRRSDVRVEWKVQVCHVGMLANISKGLVFGVKQATS